MRQTSIFDALPKYKIDKPIRLIELFAGYGSQALALKYLGVPFEHWKIAEWAVKSIQAYKDLHMPDDNTDYSAPLRAEEVYAYLLDRGISADYAHPMTHEQIRRLGESKARQIYNNIQATHNLVSVVSTRGGQLQITDTDKYCYVLTYSFPCQDLSNAGKREGMAKGANTRSGLLWEVERILKDLRELPQVLLMENVPEVAREPNRSAFLAWIDSLAEMGYRSYAKNLNAKDYGVPQNRNRCFMVSLRGGEGEYTFPQPKPLETPLTAVLEPQVDEKYYLSPEVTLHMLEHRLRNEAKGNGFGMKPIALDDRGGQYAKTITCGKCKAAETFIAEPVGGQIIEANGVSVGQSDRFYKGELKDISRTLMARRESGVAIWQKKK